VTPTKREERERKRERERERERDREKEKEKGAKVTSETRGKKTWRRKKQTITPITSRWKENNEKTRLQSRETTRQTLSQRFMIHNSKPAYVARKG
jgi:hypothetical protein